MAKELGVSTKTVYNWISVGKLKMTEPGYVSQVESYEVWLQQRYLRSLRAQNALKGINRDSYGRFKKDT